jgi:hypothetical protein
MASTSRVSEIIVLCVFEGNLRFDRLGTRHLTNVFFLARLRD